MVRGCLATSCEIAALAGGGLLQWRREGVSQFDVYSCRVRTYFVYVIKPPCNSVQIYEGIPGIYVITRVIRV